MNLDQIRIQAEVRRAYKIAMRKLIQKKAKGEDLGKPNSKRKTSPTRNSNKVNEL